VEDPQRKPGDGDRSALVARIDGAADQGRISAADRDIRLDNVASAQTMAELDLMGRDLDQLEATLPAAPVAVTDAAASEPAVADQIADNAVAFAKGTARSFGWVTAVVVVLVLIGAGSSALVALRSSGDSSSPGDGLFSPEPIPSDTVGADPSGAPSAGTPGDPGSGSAYALTVIGIRSFLVAYRARFDTTQVVDLTLYGDYAVVNVPRGDGRHAGVLYRNGDWQAFGAVAANFPGAQLVDLRNLDVPALAHNIIRARRTLGVEKPTTTYAIVRYYASSDEVPSVDIHVANGFGESGYLATRLDGTVERAYPYSDVQ
jgi:hypothetical protein